MTTRLDVMELFAAIAMSPKPSILDYHPFTEPKHLDKETKEDALTLVTIPTHRGIPREVAAVREADAKTEQDELAWIRRRYDR